jgi:hypothetical protein
MVSAMLGGDRAPSCTDGAGGDMLGAGEPPPNNTDIGRCSFAFAEIVSTDACNMRHTRSWRCNFYCNAMLL